MTGLLARLKDLILTQQRFPTMVLCRDARHRPHLGSSSVSNIAIRPSANPALSRPLGNAVERLKQDANVSPQRGSRQDIPNSKVSHRRTMSDTPMFPPTPEQGQDLGPKGKLLITTPSSSTSALLWLIPKLALTVTCGFSGQFMSRKLI